MITDRMRSWMRARSSLPRDVFVLAAIGFCVMLGFGVVIPVLPVFARSFGVGNFEVGLVVSVFAFMRLLISPVTGRLIDVRGERIILAIGMWIVAGSSAACGLAHSYVQLLIFRGLGGIGSAMFTVSAMSILISSVDAGRRGRAQSLFQGGFLLGGMAGPAVGGLLARISLTAPFFFYAATLAVAGTIGLLMLRPPHRSVDPANTTDVRSLRDVLRDPRYQAALVANFSQGWNSFGVRNSLIPVLVVVVLHEEPSWTGLAFAIAAVAQTLALAPSGRFVDTVGRRPAILIGAALTGATLVAIPFVPNIWVLVVALSVYAVGASLLGTAPSAAVGDAAGARSGTPVAVFSMTADVGAIAGPLVAGLLADRVSMPVAFATGAVLMAAACVAALRMPPGIPAVTNPASDPASDPPSDPLSDPAPPPPSKESDEPETSR